MSGAGLSDEELFAVIARHPDKARQRHGSAGRDCFCDVEARSVIESLRAAGLVVIRG